MGLNQCENLPANYYSLALYQNARVSEYSELSPLTFIRTEDNKQIYQAYFKQQDQSQIPVWVEISPNVFKVRVKDVIKNQFYGIDAVPTNYTFSGFVGDYLWTNNLFQPENKGTIEIRPITFTCLY